MRIRALHHALAAALVAAVTPLAGACSGDLFQDTQWADGVYVSPKGSDDGRGTRDNPVKTFAVAVAKASEGNGRVFACAGTFAEAIALPSGITVIGGARCLDDPSNARSVLTTPGSLLEPPPIQGRPTVTITGPNTTRLANLEIRGPLVEYFYSSVALLVVGGSLELDASVKLVAEDGGPGFGSNPLPEDVTEAPGKPGLAGDDACSPDGASKGGDSVSSTCGTVEKSAGGRGAGGDTPATRGEPASGGDDTGGAHGASESAEQATSDPSAFACASRGDGRDGAQGADGAPGEAPSALALSRAYASGALDAQVLLVGGAGGAGGRGRVGQGGGGGGARAALASECAGAKGTGAAGGSGGTGGCGGAGGSGGDAGGASVALVAVDARVFVHDAEFETAKGGRGAAGTPGIRGGLGAEGGPGGKGVEPSKRDACAGGRGGDGGDGGPGAGGHGGPSVGILVAGSAVVKGTARFAIGPGGEAGAGADGAPASPPGVSAETLALAIAPE